MKKRLVGYIRVSTGKQRDNGVSLEAQRARINQYPLWDDSVEIVEIIEESASAKCIEGRPGLMRALTMVMHGEADGVIVYKLDRLTRSVKDLIYLLEDFFVSCILISCQEHINTSGATGRM